MQQKWIAPRRDGESAFAMLQAMVGGSFGPSVTGSGSIATTRTFDPINGS
jgi:hypothetical protein